MVGLAATYDVLECDRRPTAAGEALRIRIHRHDMKPMGFKELWSVFAERYPGRWAVQVFPPKDRLLDQANKYHLFVLPEAPAGMDLVAGPPPGARAP